MEKKEKKEKNKNKPAYRELYAGKPFPLRVIKATTKHKMGISCS
jgi:hypothetical protein